MPKIRPKEPEKWDGGRLILPAEDRELAHFIIKQAQINDRTIAAQVRVMLRKQMEAHANGE